MTEGTVQLQDLYLQSWKDGTVYWQICVETVRLISKDIGIAHADFLKEVKTLNKELHVKLTRNAEDFVSNRHS